MFNQVNYFREFSVTDFTKFAPKTNFNTNSVCKGKKIVKFTNKNNHMQSQFIQDDN